MDGRSPMSYSHLSLHLDAYLSFRDALGFQMRVERTLLRDFVRFVEVRGEDGPIRAQWAVEWACALSARRGPGGAAQRLSMARGFLTYLRAIIPETEVPDHALVASFRRPQPYLFTPDQISALMQDAQKMGPRGALRPHTFSTLIGLLASTGLRVGEARRLMITDVWLDNAPSCLHIRDTKFHKSRLVPLHPSTAEHLRHYACLRTALHYDGLSDVFLFLYTLVERRSAESTPRNIYFYAVNIASTRFCISSGETSSLCVATHQRCPNSASSWPERSP